MGDFRFITDEKTFKVNFWGHDYSHDFYINWSPDDTGCDPRVYEWLAECARDARFQYEMEVIDGETRREREKAIALEQKEREELARLIAKYGDPTKASEKEG